MTTGEVIALIKALGGGGSSGGGVLVVHQDADTGALDKTWKEITDAGFSVFIVVGGVGEPAYVFILMSFDSSDHSVQFYLPGGETAKFAASSEDGYPVYVDPGE